MPRVGTFGCQRISSFVRRSQWDINTFPRNYLYELATARQTDSDGKPIVITGVGQDGDHRENTAKLLRSSSLSMFHYRDKREAACMHGR